MFNSTLKEFLERDRESIVADVSERNLCGRVANYLQVNADKAGLKGYYAEVEYNRNLGRLKTIVDEQSTLRPSFFLHFKTKNSDAFFFPRFQ